MNPEDPIYVAGHRGMVGSAIVRRLEAAGFRNLILRPRAELDLADQAAVEDFFAQERPLWVFDAAAKVGGIHANDSAPYDFLHGNLVIQDHLIHAAWRHGCRKLVFLGSSCIYPRECPQPIREEYLLTGPLEPTNEWYAVAKIAGIKLCQALRRQHGFDAISLMPTNLYGPGDNFDLQTSHVLPALIRRFHEAAKRGAEVVTAWGTGSPRREFLHVDDLADACLFAMQGYSQEQHLNVGTGEDITIRALTELVAEVTGFGGRIEWDTSKPDGTPRKLLDVSHLHELGWRHRTGLRTGIESTYRWFVEHRAEARL